MIIKLVSRYFNRDVECIKTFFKRRFRYESSLYPRFRKTLEDPDQGPGFKLDVMVEASGFGRKDMKVLEEVGYIWTLCLCDTLIVPLSIWNPSKNKKIKMKTPRA